MNGFIDTLVARSLTPAPDLPGAVRPQVRARFEPEPGRPSAEPASIEEETDATWAAKPPGATDEATIRLAPMQGEAALVPPQRPVLAGAAPADRAQSATATPAAHRQAAWPPEPAPPAPSAPLHPERGTQAHDPATTRIQASLPLQPPAPPLRRESPPAGAARAPERGPVLQGAQQTAAPVAPVTIAAAPLAPSAPAPASNASILRPAPGSPREAAPHALNLLAQPSRQRQPASRRDLRDPRHDAAPATVAPVHVSIGRIEIRAVTPARAPAAKAHGAAQPMGLDDYLRERARGEPR